MDLRNLDFCFLNSRSLVVTVLLTSAVLMLQLGMDMHANPEVDVIIVDYFGRSNFTKPLPVLSGKTLQMCYCYA